MILLRLISWPNVRKHVLRTILTTAGIVLGVSVFLGMHAANDSIRQAFASTVDRIAGKTELQISAGPAFRRTCWNACRPCLPSGSRCP
jgi:ascorbate-specific PTS system EIIC-type component UlaA